MIEMKLTGNKMFEMVKEECVINRNRKLGWYEDGDEKKDGKYVGEIENMKPNGQGTHTYSNGKKYVGEWKGGGPWIGKLYDKDGNIIGKWVNGKLH